MKPHALGVLLVIIALTLSGCNKPAVLSANAGTAVGDLPASAVRSGLIVSGTPKYIQPKIGETRGALLYSTHCNACHTSKIFWREKRLVKDMVSLKFQVRRWQSNTGLNWTEEEIADVECYLNAAYYGLPQAGRRGLLEGGKHLQKQRKN